jgi:hypothetical protein
VGFDTGDGPSRQHAVHEVLKYSRWNMLRRGSAEEAIHSLPYARGQRDSIPNLNPSHDLVSKSGLGREVLESLQLAEDREPSIGFCGARRALLKVRFHPGCLASNQRTIQEVLQYAVGDMI